MPSQWLLCPFFALTVLASQPKMRYKLQFPKTGSAYAQLISTMPLDLHEFTVCYWLKINQLNKGTNTILSYATESDDNEIRMFLEGHHRDAAHFGFDRKSTFTAKTRYRIHLGAWYYICNVWSSWDGDWEIYVNGEREANGTNIAQGLPVGKGGTIILGQDQDTVGGGMAPKDALIGELLDLNMWNEALTPNTIRDLSSCLQRMGNVIAWLNSPFAMHGGMVVAPTQLCDSLMPRRHHHHHSNINCHSENSNDEAQNEQWSLPCWGTEC